MRLGQTDVGGNHDPVRTGEIRGLVSNHRSFL